MSDPILLAALAVVGFAAGVINTLAGGGSLLTVPMLVLLGLPGTVANGTNRVGVLVQTLTAAWRFRANGIGGWRSAAAVLLPVLAGALLGALVVANLSDRLFERLFGLVMIVLLVPTLRSSTGRAPTPRAWPRALSVAVYFGIGFYGGAFQAGVGILLLLALERAGHDLVEANSIKVIVVAAVTAVAVPVFIAEDQVRWLEAGVLAASAGSGAVMGARLAVRGGDALIRPVMVGAVLLLAGRMLGFY